MLSCFSGCSRLLEFWNVTLLPKNSCSWEGQSELETQTISGQQPKKREKLCKDSLSLYSITGLDWWPRPSHCGFPTVQGRRSHFAPPRSPRSSHLDVGSKFQILKKQKLIPCSCCLACWQLRNYVAYCNWTIQIEFLEHEYLILWPEETLEAFGWEDAVIWNTFVRLSGKSLNCGWASSTQNWHIKFSVLHSLRLSLFCFNFWAKAVCVCTKWAKVTKGPKGHGDPMVLSVGSKMSQNVGTTESEVKTNQAYLCLVPQPYKNPKKNSGDSSVHISTRFANAESKYTSVPCKQKPASGKTRNL